jgi:hypothetical protein
MSVTILHQRFILPLKTNRKVVLSLEEKRRGQRVAVSALDLPAGQPANDVSGHAVDAPRRIGNPSKSATYPETAFNFSSFASRTDSFIQKIDLRTPSMVDRRVHFP